jgi:hypothetical protein
LDIDNEFRLLELMRELFVLPFQFGVTADKEVSLLCDRSSLLGNKALVNLAPPRGKAR